MDADSPVQTYERLLRQLHKLIADGKGDTQDADDLRDAMDGPYYAMSKADREEMVWLSLTLYQES